MPEARVIPEPPNNNPEFRAAAAPHHDAVIMSRRNTRLARMLVLCGGCVCNFAAAATAPRAPDWRHLLTDKVLACGVAAVTLLVLSFLLRGLLKVITLALVVVLAAGVFWFLRDGFGTQTDALPHEWTKLAEHTLESPKARVAWQTVQSELARLSADTRTRLAAGTDDARRIVVTKLEARSQKLRKEGNTADAEQLARLAALVEKQK